MSWPLSAGLGRFGYFFYLLAILSSCSSRTPEPAAPVVSGAASAGTESDSEAKLLAERAEELRRSLSASEQENARLLEKLELRNSALTALEEENARLLEEVALRKSTVTALEEQNATLELELVSALEELLRVQANLKNVESRAFAVSRVAELRVELESLKAKQDPAIADRLDRAEGFVTGADQALRAGNVGGAAFLAERGGELVRQSKIISEIRSRESTALLPIVPPREMEVRVAANLRSGPSLEAERVATVAAGTRLEAVARLGDWFQVRTASGRTLWIYRVLVTSSF